MAKCNLLSIVIPVYNEERRIRNSLLTLFAFLKNQKYSFEVIISDDGSTDQTLKIVEDIAKDNPVKLIKDSHYGKGAAVRRGFLASSGDKVLLMDADLATDLKEINRFCYDFNDKLVIGSRRLHQRPKRGLLRWVASAFFAFWVNFLLKLGIKDTQCGFKLVDGETARLLGQQLKINGFAFDVEMLYLAHKYKLSVKEAAVCWQEKENFHFNFFALLKAFLDVLKIKKYHQKKVCPNERSN